MFASHLSGPVAHVRHQQLLTEAAHERVLMLVEGISHLALLRGRILAMGSFTSTASHLVLGETTRKTRPAAHHLGLA